MGRGSPISKNLQTYKLWNSFRIIINVKLGEILNISLFTVHDIIKRFTKYGEISVRKGQVSA